MSGRKINDYGGMPHTSDMAMDSKNKLKKYESCEGSGHLGASYPDTTEDIHRDQEAGVRHAEARKIRPGYRN